MQLKSYQICHVRFRGCIAEYSGGERCFDNLVIDLVAQKDRLLHRFLIVRLSTLGLDVLLDTINGGLVSNKALLDFVESVIDLVLKNHVTASIVLHSVVSRLLGDTGTVGTNLTTNRHKSLLFSFVLSLQIIDAGELVCHLILHAFDVLAVNEHLVIHATFKICNLLQISSTSFYFNL